MGSTCSALVKFHSLWCKHLAPYTRWEVPVVLSKIPLTPVHQPSHQDAGTPVQFSYTHIGSTNWELDENFEITLKYEGFTMKK